MNAFVANEDAEQEACCVPKKHVFPQIVTRTLYVQITAAHDKARLFHDKPQLWLVICLSFVDEARIGSKNKICAGRNLGFPDFIWGLLVLDFWKWWVRPNLATCIWQRTNNKLNSWRWFQYRHFAHPRLVKASSWIAWFVDSNGGVKLVARATLPPLSFRRIMEGCVSV